MVRTVSRSSVAKCPDIGATISTFGCGLSVSFLKCNRVANEATWVISSVTATGASAPVTVTWSIAKGRLLCVTSLSSNTSSAAASLRLGIQRFQP